MQEKKIVLTSKSTEIEAYLFNQDISNFTNILHPGAEFKENSYEVQIKQNVLVGDFSGLDVVEAGPSYDTDTIFAAPSYGMYVFFVVLFEINLIEGENKFIFVV